MKVIHADIMAKTNDRSYDPNADHDLLVRLDTKFEGMAIDIKDLKDGTAQMLAKVQLQVEENSREINNFKSGMRAMRWVLGVQAGAIAFITGLIAWFMSLIRP